jgi:hypothetical protein
MVLNHLDAQIKNGVESVKKLLRFVMCALLTITEAALVAHCGPWVTLGCVLKIIGDELTSL